jgi:predicted dehydrogenase
MDAPETEHPPLRWGIVGTGGIAAAFRRDLRLLPDHAVVAVGSRSAPGAAAFADEHGIAHRHASYAALAADPDVDAVYVATPHPGHHDAAMLAIEAGKAVLVEKPFTMDAAQARSLAAAAHERGTFLLEAMWTRFLPHVVAIRELLAAGAIGEVVLVTAEHGQWFADDPGFRLFAPELGGGALLDLGVYPVSFAHMVLGVPTRIAALSDPAFTGVDAQTSMLLQYDSGAHAVLTTTLRGQSECHAAIVGREGRIEIDGVFYRPTSFRLVRRDGRSDGEVTTYAFDEPGHGLRHQAAEVARCVRAGLTESPVLPPSESVAIMETLDEVRRQIGLRYAGVDD